MSVDPLLIDTATKVFADTCTHDVIERAERDGWAGDAWDAVAGVGLPWIGVDEDAGGSGGTLADAVAVLKAAGAHAVPLPIAETMLASWLLASAGIEVDEAPTTVIPGSTRDNLQFDGGTVTGVAYEVPWAAASGRIATLVATEAGWSVATFRPGALRIEPSRNLAGEPRETVHFDGVAPDALAASPIDRDAFMLRGALTRVALTAGAIQRMSDMTVAYTAERKQFGQPVGRFQLVQAHLVHLAQDAAVVGIAADAAARDASPFTIGSAKAIASAAATSAAAAAHQAHGAMGMTREYTLHHLSRRLWSWRTEYGDAPFWERRVGELAVATAPDALYPLVSGTR